MATKKKAVRPPTWTELNNRLRTCDEKYAADLLQIARASKWSERFITRIYGRFQTKRREREELELAS